MPTYRLNKTVSLVHGIQAFLRIETGVTRGNAPEDMQRRTQAQKLKPTRSPEYIQRTQAKTLKPARPKTRKKLRKKRRELAQIKKEINRLEASGPIRSFAKRSPKTAGKDAGDIELGALPNFLIIGTEKGGTSTFYWTLCQHPQVEPAIKKELHFFDSHRWFELGVEWYRSQFPAPMWRDGRKVITGEATPYYLLHPYSPRRVSTTLPNAKLIALLRNPVDRAYSAYRHRVRKERESLSFEKALQAEEERTSGELEKMLSDETYHNRAYPWYTYRSRGIYVDQLKRWHEHFAPDQLLVLKSEDYFADPIGTMGLVYEFLDLPEYDISIERSKKRSYPPMDPATRRQLEDFFEPHNQRLYEYLGVDFGW